MVTSAGSSGGVVPPLPLLCGSGSPTVKSAALSSVSAPVRAADEVLLVAPTCAVS